MLTFNFMHIRLHQSKQNPNSYKYRTSSEWTWNYCWKSGSMRRH